MSVQGNGNREQSSRPKNPEELAREFLLSGKFPRITRLSRKVLGCRERWCRSSVGGIELQFSCAPWGLDVLAPRPPRLTIPASSLSMPCATVLSPPSDMVAAAPSHRPRTPAFQTSMT